MTYDAAPLDGQAGRTGRASSDAHRRRGIRHLITLPLAVIGTIAVTLGIAQPAEAAPQSSKRMPKAKPSSTDAAATHTTPRSVGRSSNAAPPEVTVGDGDTVSGIAERYGVATADILALNGLSWSSLIFAGQRLALPGGASAPATSPVAAELPRHIVVAGDTMSGIAAVHGVSLDQMLSANGLSRQSLIFPGQSIVLPPGGGEAVSASAAPDAPASPPTAPVAPVASVSVALTEEMRSNASIIIEVGRSLGVPEQGIVVALAAAAQESGLKNSDYGDLDSLGLFQQRPSQGWGTVDEVLDPVRAASAFYGGAQNPNAGRTVGLLDIAGWESLTVTQAAQAVQVSEFPDHYAKWETAARAWLSELG
ncbi:LysM peptidoglycan-binding domain-containing protein [Agromyces laixinhei]|uniref:LysM peptidoglycan-binding domain-containing protein n=1 Tax=Agromyces laixinhei TaxID=2585717 RepID=UPI001117320E|nr:LysM peptidoglycan-binding domain-containing protein [Agromyces laixinhei]